MTTGGPLQAARRVWLGAGSLRTTPGEPSVMWQDHLIVSGIVYTHIYCLYTYFNICCCRSILFDMLYVVLCYAIKKCILYASLLSIRIIYIYIGYIVCYTVYLQPG